MARSGELRSRPPVAGHWATRCRGVQTWRTIRAASLTLFEERGFDAVTIDEIAAAANVARGTFFNYFESREAVVVTYGPHEAEVQRSLIASSVHIPLWGQ
ncbi:hypothetical protein BOG92_007165 [Streptomyces sp. WAC00263]|nr:hypothetical protein BOG92_007165 [Streptomyces sp. WAC00263]